MTVAERARMRPVLYPALILVAFVLNFLVDTGVSPYAAGRPLIVAVTIGLLVPWLAGLVTADRDRAGFVGLIAAAVIVGGRIPAAVVLCLLALALIAVLPLLRRLAGSSPRRVGGLLPVVTRVLTAGALILVVAVGIKAVQLDRVGTFAEDLVDELPLRPRPVAAVRAPVQAPNIFLVLLDGYPRADKLQSEFGIDNSRFVEALRARDFVVADHGRSNLTLTALTLAQMFDYRGTDEMARDLDGTDRLWRRVINGGAFFRDLHGLGYETVAVSPGFEHVALRRADVFVDTGQLNEFEWAVTEMTVLAPLADMLVPNIAADLHRSRILDAFAVAEAEARTLGSARKLVFVHVLAPHAPQVFDASGRPLDLPGFMLPYGDELEIENWGLAEYSRRLEGQLQFVNEKTLHLVDTVAAADPGAVIVVFSDHGSGAHAYGASAESPDVDLRTANLLAVRSPGRAGIIDDRSTLVNLLPRLLRAYTGTGPADKPETIFGWTGDPSSSLIYERPD
jgi:hypothetical protein